MTRQSSSPQIPFTLSGAGLGGLQGCHLGVPGVEMKVPCPPPHVTLPHGQSKPSPYVTFIVCLTRGTAVVRTEPERANEPQQVILTGR